MRAKKSRELQGMSRLFVALAASIILLGFLTIFSQPRMLSASGSTLAGWVWSDNIGWISLSCTTGGATPPGNNICASSNYGLAVDGAGIITGYAWSDNIGWISAQDADVNIASCPSWTGAGSCTPKLISGTMTGWLRATAATGNGWDGWISLNCSNKAECGTSNYGVTSTGTGYTGYAWGSDVVGWIDFSAAVPPPATCSIVPDSASVVQYSNTTLRWTSTNSTGGTITTLGAVAANGSAAVQPLTSTTYMGNFSGPGGNATCQTTVGVTCAPQCQCAGAVGGDGRQHTINHTDNTCAIDTVTNCGAVNYCTPGLCTCQIPDVTVVQKITADPVLVRTGATSTISWSIQNATSCSVSGNGDSWTGLTSSAAACTHSPSGTSCITRPISVSQVYTLTCVPLGATTFTPQSVTIVPSPDFHER